MEIVKWQNQNWDEIEEQDNPAFDYIGQERKNGRRAECLLIMKVREEVRISAVGMDSYQVMKVPKEGDVDTLGLFWTWENANIFAEVYANAQSI